MKFKVPSAFISNLFLSAPPDKLQVTTGSLAINLWTSVLFSSIFLELLRSPASPEGPFILSGSLIIMVINPLASI